MFRIRGEEGLPKYSGSALHHRLSNFYRGEHVSVEQTTRPGIKRTHFISVTAEGKVKQTYGKCRPVNFIRLEIAQLPATA